MESEKSYGPIIGLVIIILVIALGSVYFLQKREEAPTPKIQDTEQVSENDDIETLESEIDATVTEDLDAEIDGLEAQL